jgi:hypothetical protein
VPYGLQAGDRVETSDYRFVYCGPAGSWTPVHSGTWASIAKLRQSTALLAGMFVSCRCACSKGIDLMHLHLRSCCCAAGLPALERPCSQVRTAAVSNEVPGRAAVRVLCTSGPNNSDCCWQQSGGLLAATLSYAGLLFERYPGDSALAHVHGC